MTTGAGPRPDPDTADTPPGHEYKTTGTQSQLRQVEAHLEMRMSVCFIQTSSFYIPISAQATFKVATHCLMRTN